MNMELIVLFGKFYFYSFFPNLFNEGDRKVSASARSKNDKEAYWKWKKKRKIIFDKT